jgi:hypothetical protein
MLPDIKICQKVMRGNTSFYLFLKFLQYLL